MAKWYSVLFSDIRNKLGDQVVFGNWKGRGYFRSYVIPANPQTSAQEANREHLADTVKIWQTFIKTNDAAVRAWNNIALKEQISGFNLMTKQGRTSYITATYAGGTVSGTYKVGFAPADAAIAVFKEDGTLVNIIKAAGTLAEQGTYSASLSLQSGKYFVAIINAKVLEIGEGLTAKNAIVCRGKPNEENGTFDIASITVS